jgi:Uma2 family endonuclease
MSEALISPPRTVMQVFKMLPVGTLAEVIDNSLYMSPAPTPFHQRALGDLFYKVATLVKGAQLGEVFISPVDLYLDEESNAVQPDILFISKDNPLKIDRDGLHGSPDLIIEILSPGNKSHDQVRKKELYEKFGVREYWTIDPDTKQASGYVLHGNLFESIGEIQSEIQSTLLKATFPF